MISLAALVLMAALGQEAPAAGHSAPATTHAAPSHGAPANAHAAPADAHAVDHDDPATVLMHHVTDQPWEPFGIHVFYSKHLAFLVIAALLVIVMAQLAMRSYGPGGIPRGIGSAVESMVIFVRDEIAEKNIGHDGHKFVPLLLSFFFFILIAALLGLVPFTATSTGNIAVTLALAIISFGAQQWGGIGKYGLVGHFKNLVPPGVPLALLPLMVIVEVLGMFTKPFALMIRLFANMLAGHMVITTLLLLIPLMAKVTPVAGIMMAPVSLGLALFIMLLEVLVAFIQAYIFTLLTSIFIGMYAHPAH